MKKIPTWVEIDLDRLAGNLDVIERRVGSGVRVLLTVKADAYGHGAVQVAQACESRVAMLGVATLDEALELREAGVGAPVLILSPILETEVPLVIESGFAVSASTFGVTRRISDHASARGACVPVHVEIDTGMGRTGIAEEFGVEEVVRIAALPGVRLDGVYTHFPVSDTDPAFTRAQVERFDEIVSEIRARGVTIPAVHSANSAAVADILESHMDMVRPGLLAYGLAPGGNDAAPEGIVPILSWKSRLVRVRRVPAGRSLSYGRDFVTARDSVIGVVPVGYGHGYPFRATHGGEMLVAGTRVPVVGRVTMDMTLVDLTDLDVTPTPGEEVTLVGRQGDGAITFHDLAGWAGTICYEVMCGISKRVPRTYFRRGKVETYKSLLGVLPNHVAV